MITICDINMPVKRESVSISRSSRFISSHTNQISKTSNHNLRQFSFVVTSMPVSRASSIIKLINGNYDKYGESHEGQAVQGSPRVVRASEKGLGATSDAGTFTHAGGVPFFSDNIICFDSVSTTSVTFNLGLRNNWSFMFFYNKTLSVATKSLWSHWYYDSKGTVLQNNSASSPSADFSIVDGGLFFGGITFPTKIMVLADFFIFDFIPSDEVRNAFFNRSNTNGMNPFKAPYVTLGIEGEEVVCAGEVGDVSYYNLNGVACCDFPVTLYEINDEVYS